MTIGNSGFPDWDLNRVIPPNIVEDPIGIVRSPYAVSLIDLVERLGHTEMRRGLLCGLLAFRAELRTVGIVEGFQWIDGSFVENVEEREKRSPNDIDLVTFFCVPDGSSRKSLFDDYSELFAGKYVKEKYGLHSFFVLLNETSIKLIIDSVAYWQSLFSHTRDGLWKGYLRVDLDDCDDEAAGALLLSMAGKGDEL